MRSMQAQEWAAKIEAEATNAHYRLSSRKTLADAIEQFRMDVSPSRRGSRWEDLRLASFAERETQLCARQLSSLTEADFAAWRDRRVGEVSASTVRREFALLGAVLGIARREWRWLSHDPLKIKKPSEPPARRRGVTREEVIGILSHANEQVSCAFLLALETGMRAGEILSLTWGNVDLDRRVALLPKTKNGDSRQVPLSAAAIYVLRELQVPVMGEADSAQDSRPQPNVGKVYTITGPSLDALFRKARAAAVHACPSIRTLRFHDSRSEAISRLSKRLDVLELARTVGHRNVSQLLTYFHVSASDLAKKLD